MGVYLGNKPVAITKFIETIKGGDYNLKVTDLGETQRIDITIATEDKELNITLPEEFAEQRGLTHFVLNNDKILIGGSQTGVGLQLYTISTNSWKQLAPGYGWDSYKIIGNYCLANSTAAFWSVDTINETAVKLFDNNGYKYFQQITDDKWLIGGSGNSYEALGILKYTPSTNTVEQLYDVAESWQKFIKVTENKWLIGAGRNSSYGLLLYDSNTDIITKIYEGTDWNVKARANENEWILSDGERLIIYNSITDEITLLVSNGSNVAQYITKVTDNKYLYIGDNNYVYALDISNKSVTEALSTDLKYVGTNCMLVINGNCLCSSYQSSGGVGIWLYKSEDDSFTKIYETGYNWKYYAIDNNNNKILLSSESTTNSGILLYNNTDYTITQIYSTSNKWKYYSKISYANVDKWVIRSDSSSSVLVYNMSSNNILEYTATSKLEFAQQVSDAVLLLSGYTTGILKFDASTNTFTKTSYYGVTNSYNYNTFVKVDNGYYISSSDKARSPYTIFYNVNNDSLTTVGYYINTGGTE